MSKRIPANPCAGRPVPRRDEPLRDATLIEHLDGAGEQTPGSRAVDLLVGASFDDDDVDPRQRQLARQHQPGRAAACDHHRVLGHAVMVSTFGSLAASPLPRVTLLVAAMFTRR